MKDVVEINKNGFKLVKLIRLDWIDVSIEWTDSG